MKDFTGFQFCGVHSSTLNIVRVSEGSRYSENLISAFQDKTVQKTGSDGTLYWESFYTSRTWTINVAFDDLTESDYRAVRAAYSAKKIGDLIFDELPYKVYTAKVQSPPIFKTICFEETIDNTVVRKYKGEGTIQFISYNPYARSKYKYKASYDSSYDNIDEWYSSSGLLSEQGNYDGTNSSKITVHNGGDLETDWIAFYPYTAQNGHFTNLTQIALTSNDVNYGIIKFSGITSQNVNDSYIRINSKTNLIEGCDSNKETTGSLYNQFIVSGDFFKIPQGDFNFASTGCSCASIEYDYLYY